MGSDPFRWCGRPAAIIALALCLTGPTMLAACDEASTDGAPSASSGTGVGAAETLATLVETLRTGTRTERAAAAADLAALDDPAAVPALVEALADESWEVRAAVAQAFVTIPDPRAAAALLALIADEPAEPEIRVTDLWTARDACASAMSALGLIGATEAVPRLAAIAVDPATGLDREAAAEAIEAIGEPALPALTEALDKATGTRAPAVVALLARLGDPALDILVTTLRDRRLGVRTAAAEALSGFGDAAVTPLIAALDGRGAELVSAAARSLGEIGDDRATKSLVGLVGDPDTRRAAVGALVRIHRDDATPLVRYLRSRATVGVYRPLIRIGQKDTVPALVTALERFGSETMGETYLNCGEPRLEEAAKRWAKAHGYIVTPGMGTAEEAWGGS